MTWGKSIVHWRDNGSVNVSVVFTWHLPLAHKFCERFHDAGFSVRVGGPAIRLMPEYMADVALVDGNLDALPRHNDRATFTSRGCIRSCKFCAVPRIEGDLRELKTWEPRPIVCDNNLLACSRKHFNKVIDKLKPVNDIDFNQGLDCRLLTDYHVDRLRELDIETLRFSWDFVSEESAVMGAIERCLKAGFTKSKIRVYVLFGFMDTPEDALYRLQTLRNMKILSNPQWYQPIEKSDYGDPLIQDSYVAPGWTLKELKRYRRYWSRTCYFGKLPFAEYV